ncbi:calcium-transporting ATPase 12, plasma membrane-type-like [Apium graveolens]|uniref:calcium-transporting ATPase 12, plasma membrane-type-like n=1 Tax=Apium graveolens TaxID=4045 RepID=UPI003D78DFDB
MSAIIDQSRSCIGSLPKLKFNSIKRRWHRAFATIYTSRAFSRLNRSPKPQFHHQISRSSLIHLVKDKDLAYLENLGGIDAVVSALETDAEHGLLEDNAADISRRQETYGFNTYPRLPAKGVVSFLMKALMHSTVFIELIGAVLSLVFDMKIYGAKEGWYQGGSIVVAMFLVITVSTLSNFKQSRQLDRLSQMSNNIQVKVVRNRKHQQISIFDVVVGDIILLSIGDQVPADGLFVSGHSLQIDVSNMTGESDHVDINRKTPYLLSGAKVANGYAKFVVTSVGMNTTWGEMMSSVMQVHAVKTPFQARIDKLTSLIGKIILVVAFIVHLVLLLWFFLGHTKDEDGKTEFKGRKTAVDVVINGVREALIAAISIVFVTIPEGLPLAVTLVLAYSMKRMMSDQAMVRKLSACETVGSATTICTHKTGILTVNKMKVTKFCLGKELIEEMNYASIDSNVLEFIHQGAGLNTAGSVYKPNLESNWEFSGSPTEKAILSWVVSLPRINMDDLKRSCKLLHVEAFNSEKMKSGILLQKDEDNTFHIHWKGAPEIIAAMCSHYYDLHGNVKALTDSERKKFDQVVQGMAASSLHCIAFAHKQVSVHESDNASAKLKDENLTLLGLVGLKNPCHPEVWEAVQDCQIAGVRVKMITGDSVFTAQAIASHCGILKLNQDMKKNELYNGAVIEGVEFRNYTQEERMEKVENICVMARSSPLDKLLMVQCLKQKGHVVAVTGDGTNDAPALLEADIGLSMGNTGTEVAKESSDIVILDDNFSTVVNVLKWGRCVYKNIQKFIQFQLTVNVAALVINFVAAVSTGEVPLTAVKLVWINLIMDTLGALALATEEPTKALMEKEIVGHKEPLISNVMWRNSIAQAIYQIIVISALQFGGKDFFDVSKKVKDTMIFNTFVLCQVFNGFNARKLEKKNVFVGMHKNKLFLSIIGIIIIFQVLMIEFLVKFTDTNRLSWGLWKVCIEIALVSWPIGFLVKFIPVPDKPLFRD